MESLPTFACLIRGEAHAFAKPTLWQDQLLFGLACNRWSTRIDVFDRRNGPATGKDNGGKTELIIRM